jgi:peptide/nickel transport system permease protein
MPEPGSRAAVAALPGNAPVVETAMPDDGSTLEPMLPLGAGDAAKAGQWRLMWWRFRKHKLALASLIVVVLIYLVALFAEFLSPSSPERFSQRHAFAPPQAIHLFHRDASGARVFLPHVKDYAQRVDPVAMRRIFVPDETRIIPIGLFVETQPYQLMGFIPMSRRLIGPLDQSRPFFLLGADRLGRDMLSRTIHGTRVSMSIGLVGVAISLFLGVLLGGISGYFGGAIDTVVQRVIEFIRAIPTIPLWMGLAAAVPPSWSPLAVYFVITLIVSLIGWTGLAREVRGRFLSMRTEDFVAAATLDGASELRVILRHMVPSFISHIIATTTLVIPAMILSETALSFLGIGLRPPVVSWGVLLQDAQNIRAVSTAPWLMLPGVAVIVAILSLNFLGDGMRDAADPYGN